MKRLAILFGAQLVAADQVSDCVTAYVDTRNKMNPSFNNKEALRNLVLDVCFPMSGSLPNFVRPNICYFQAIYELDSIEQQFRANGEQLDGVDWQSRAQQFCSSIGDRFSQHAAIVNQMTDLDPFKEDFGQGKYAEVASQIYSDELSMFTWHEASDEKFNADDLVFTLQMTHRDRNEGKIDVEGASLYELLVLTAYQAPFFYQIDHLQNQFVDNCHQTFATEQNAEVDKITKFCEDILPERIKFVSWSDKATQAACIDGVAKGLESQKEGLAPLTCTSLLEYVFSAYMNGMEFGQAEILTELELKAVLESVESVSDEL